MGKCFQKGMKGLAIQDFELYPPDEQYICFIAAPIIRYGESAGVIALKLSTAKLDGIVQQREGMGKPEKATLSAKATAKSLTEQIAWSSREKSAMPNPALILKKYFPGKPEP
ncbi:MAG: hypothetical protein HC887_10460 [Desulfobacteraceae bacterium]|nr:hypothetical protein [Desulfobacteraceae bacterium]